MSDHQIMLSRVDRSRLFQAAERAANPGGRPNPAIRGLNRLLNKASFVDPAAVPPDLVTMGSRLRIRVEGEPAAREITLVFPEDASFDDARYSILTPMALALLGSRSGDTVAWQAPSGEFHATIEAVLFQPEASMQHA
jgi:regulator of nucleoside diphosphate kinase